MNIENPLNLVVAKRINETEEILSVDLVDPDGQDLPPFEAGAHIDVQVCEGLVRQYSLCNSPTERHRYRLGILRAPESRGGSSSLHGGIREGMCLTVGRPRNTFRLREGGSYAVLVGGGIGITPLMSMAHRLHELKKSFELHYCVKLRSKGAFIEELEASPFRSNVIFHFDDGPSEQRLNPTAFENQREVDVYLCGPTGFMEWVQSSAITAGMMPNRIHLERFAGTPVTDGTSFTIKTARSGITTIVTGEQTIVAALHAVGVTIPISCEQGICGTCLTRVIEGVPDHQDLYQTDDEKAANTQITPCCSRSKSNVLVLDI